MFETNCKEFLSTISKLQNEILAKSIDLFGLKLGEFSQKAKIKQLEIGIELEFYLLNSQSKLAASSQERQYFIEMISKLNGSKDLINGKITEFKTEQGQGQIEVVFAHDSDLLKLCELVEIKKQEICELAKNNGFIADFAGLPFEDDCGSALQFNISFTNQEGKNVFFDEVELQKKCATKLLLASNYMLLLLIDQPQDLKRFDCKINQKLFASGKHVAPVNLSFGFNNRSCAIRLLKERLEFRIPSANANIWLAMSAVLISLTLDEAKFNSRNISKNMGKNFELQNFQPIYGNAFDENYQLNPILTDFSEVCERFFDENNPIFKNFILFVAEIESELLKKNCR